MVKTKTTLCGGKSHCPAGMTTATFAGGADADPVEQFLLAPGRDTEGSQDFSKVLEDAKQEEEGEAGTSKSKGKTGNPPK